MTKDDDAKPIGPTGPAGQFRYNGRPIPYSDGSYRQDGGTITFWKPLNKWNGNPGRPIRKLVAPRGYDTLDGFAKRHKLVKSLPRIYVSEPVYPIPHLYDEQTGRTYIHRKKGDEWLAQLQNDPQTYARLRTLANNIKAMERMAKQFKAAHYAESHDLCLKMVETFKRETGYDSLLQQRMGGGSQSKQETS